MKHAKSRDVFAGWDYPGVVVGVIQAVAKIAGDAGVTAKEIDYEKATVLCERGGAVKPEPFAFDGRRLSFMGKEVEVDRSWPY